MTLRRGKATDLVFARAITATRSYHSTAPGTGRSIEVIEPMTIAEARELFETFKRAKMRRRGDGVFVFVIGTSTGYERVEIEVA